MTIPLIKTKIVPHKLNEEQIMKKIIVLLSMTLSGYLYSCPNLAGTWTCDDGEEEYSFTLEQFVNNAGHTVYVQEGESELITDGQWHDQEDGSDYKATCQSSTVLQIDGKDGDVDIETTITLFHLLNALL